MKIYNLTDVSTPVLKQRHLEDQTFSVDGRDVAPGASVEVPAQDASHVQAQLAFLINVGALAVDRIPDSYTSGKQKALEDKYKDIKDSKDAEAAPAPEPARPTPTPPVKVTEKVEAKHDELPAPPPVPTTVSAPELPAPTPPEDPRLPTTDVPPARRKGGG